MTPVLPGTWIGEVFTGDLGEAQKVIEFSLGEQPGIRGDFGTVTFQLQTTVELQPQLPQIRFTRRCAILAAPHRLYLLDNYI